MHHNESLQPRQRKSLSQVFLKTDEPCKDVLNQLHKWNVTHVLEIGPGDGIMTFLLLRNHIHVTAVEKDARFSRKLKLLYQARDYENLANLTVVEADILQWDIHEWIQQMSKHSIAIVGNIPYQISTPIIMKALAHIEHVKGVMLLTQKEFAERLASPPHSKVYGSLSVYAQLRAQVELGSHVDKTMFQPQPKVDSAFIKLTPHEPPLSLTDQQLRHIEIITQASFHKRRKKLRNSLKAWLSQKQELGTPPVNLDLRPENLSPQEFAALAQYIFT